MTTCCPNRLLFYNTNIRYSIITKHPLYNSISSPVIKTARQPFNHHTFCTPLTRHQHCSVNLVLTTPIIQFSTVIGFKVLLYHQNLFKTGFQSDLYCYQKPLYSSISFPYSIVPSFQLYRSIIPTLKRSSKKVFCPDCIFVSTNLFSILPTTFTTSQL